MCQRRRSVCLLETSCWEVETYGDIEFRSQNNDNGLNIQMSTIL